MPSRLDDDPFLQVDLNQWVPVTEVAVEGSMAVPGWVTGYSLSYKENVAPWAFVPYTTNHSVEVCFFCLFCFCLLLRRISLPLTAFLMRFLYFLTSLLFSIVEICSIS